MRHLLVAVSMLLGSATSAGAQVGVHVGIGVALPGVQVGIHVPAYPRLVQVPGQPVYYAPGVSSNYFFYDGAYWVFHGDSWYVSSWYAGPWYLVAPEEVPVFVLRVPVRYYRAPPPYFRAWHANAPPRWGDRYPHAVERQHEIRSSRYAYRPHEPVTRQHDRAHGDPGDARARRGSDERRSPGHPPARGKDRGERDDRSEDDRSR